MLQAADLTIYVSRCRRIALAALAAIVAGHCLAADERRPARGPVYGAIAYHAGTDSVGWATDRKSAREAKVEALRQCSHEKCEVIASVTRGCAALARAPKKFAVQKGATRLEAETKALRRCGPGCEAIAWTCTR